MTIPNNSSAFAARASRLARGAAILITLLLLVSATATAQPAQSSPSKTIKLQPEQLQGLIGQYSLSNEPEIILSFSSEGSHFYVESARRPRHELFAGSENLFFVKGGRADYTFTRGPDGNATSVKVGDNPGEEATKISPQPVHYVFPHYNCKEVMIPMRDGVRLHAVILRPTDVKTPLPFLMQRTPYGVDGATSDSINTRYTELANSGYIFVMEDIRGRFKSEGTFVMSRPMGDHRDPKQVDESTDTYDTVAWLLKNIPNNNGRVGVMGISYPGFLAMAAGIDPHPAVRAISPQAPMIDVWLGDDFFHNGAFRETYGYDYVLGMESSKENTFRNLDTDAYDYFLKAGSFAAAARQSGLDKLPTGQDFLDHPAYDEFWRARAVEWHLNHVTVPTLLVGGQWDQEDMWGPQEAYKKLEPHDAKGVNFLVLGPWNHGEWGATTRHLGAVDFGEPTTDEFRERYEAPFFAHYLKDEGTFGLKDTASFESGNNQWKEYDHWPPREATERNLYLEAQGKLSFNAPQNKDEKNFTQYVSDPANPVPYRERPIEATYAPTGSGWYTWMAQDQRFVSQRADVAQWTTPPLDHDVTVAGNVIADLFASTTGTDSDWVVKLIDVYPDDLGKMAGYQLMVAGESFRGRYRQSFEHPEAIPANAVEEYRYSLHAVDHTFLKGHRMMVEVQSTWFPLYDRNPQRFVPNIMTAAPEDFQKATQRVYGSSHLILPMLEKK
ncbi:MAG: CocE/NonD family hydrolase [Terriglobia bacterium]